MGKERLNIINKLTIPTDGKSDKSQEIFENLENITPEEIQAVGDNIDLDEIKRMLSGSRETILEKRHAMLLIKKGEIDLFVDNIENFSGLDKEIAIFLINNGYLDALYENLEDFNGIDKEVVKKYIEKQSKDKVYDLSKLEGLLDKEMAIFMIDNGYIDTLYENLEHFNGIDKEVVKKYIEKNEEYIDINVDDYDDEDDISGGLENFKGLLDKEIAILLIEKGYLGSLYVDLEYFEGIDKEVVKKYIEKLEEDIDNCEGDDDEENISRDLSKFKGLLDKEIATSMIDNGYLGVLYENLEYFEGISKEVLKKFIEKLEEDEDDYENGNIDNSYRDLEKFNQLFDKSIAMFMADNGYIKTLYANIEYIKGIDKEIVKKYIEKQDKDKLYDLSKFKGLLDKEIAMILIDNGNLETLYENLEYFKGIDNGYDSKIYINKEDLEGIDKEVVKKYIEKQDKEKLYELSKFKGKLDNEIAMFMIDNGHYKTLANSLQDFRNDLNDKVASELIEKGYKAEVKEHKGKFKDLGVITKMRLRGK